jgi:hypothetical protein
LFLHSLLFTKLPELPPHLFYILWFGVAGIALAMKFNFEIKIEPTLCTLVVISIVACCSGSLASIAIYLDNPATGIYCTTILAIIVFLALFYSFH